MISIQWENRAMKIRNISVVYLLFPLLLTGCFKTRQDIAREKEETEVRSSLQTNIVQYNQNVERLESEIGKLQGRIEELEHNRKKELSGLSSGRENDQKSLEEIKAKLNGMQEAQNALFEEIKKLKEEGVAASSSRAAPAAPAASGKKKGNSGSFEAAVSAYKSKDFPGAVSGFQTFIETSPKSKKAIDAHFFLGDSYFKQKNYEQAVAEFGVVHEKAANTALGRKATLRIAQSFKAMGKGKDAKAFAALLVEGSPNSDEAKQARKLLK